MFLCARSSTDRVPVFGTVDVGSIPAGRTRLRKVIFITFRCTCASRSATARGGVAQKFSRILCVTTRLLFSARRGREIFCSTEQKILVTTLFILVSVDNRVYIVHKGHHRNFVSVLQKLPILSKSPLFVRLFIKDIFIQQYQSPIKSKLFHVKRREISYTCNHELVSSL